MFAAMRAAGACGCETIEMQVLCLNGEEYNFTLSGSTLGQEVRQNILQRVPSKKGRRYVIDPSQEFTAAASPNFARARHCG